MKKFKQTAAFILTIILIIASNCEVYANISNLIVLTGYDASYFIDDNSNLWVCGYYYDINEKVNKRTQIPQIIDVDVKKCLCIAQIFIVLKNDGTLVTFPGYDISDSDTLLRVPDDILLGRGDKNDDYNIILTDVKDINILSGTSVTAVKNDGTLWAWGYIADFTRGDDPSEKTYFPVKVMDNVSDVKRLSSFWYAVETLDGKIYMYGTNEYGEFGNGTVSNSDEKLFLEVDYPFEVQNMDSISYNQMYAIDDIGNLYMWGLLSGNIEETPKEELNIVDTPIIIDTNIKKMFYCNGYRFVLKNDDTLWLYKNGEYDKIRKIADDVKDCMWYKYTEKEYTRIDYYLAILDNNGDFFHALISEDNLNSGNIQFDFVIGDVENIVEQNTYSPEAMFVEKTDGTLWVWGNNGSYNLGVRKKDNYLFSPQQNIYNTDISEDEIQIRVVQTIADTDNNLYIISLKSEDTTEITTDNAECDDQSDIREDNGIILYLYCGIVMVLFAVLYAVIISKSKKYNGF